MTGRAIVRAPDGQAITWVIDGTLIRVADLKRDYQVAGNQVFPVYRAMGLTDSEINAALAFYMPPVRGTTLDVRLVDLVINCECGEHTHAVRAGSSAEPIECICGRTWRVPLPTRPAAAANGAQPPDPAEGPSLSNHAQGQNSRHTPTEADTVSLDVTVIVRAQQLVDRWARTGQHETFAEIVDRAADEFDRDHTLPVFYRAIFIALAGEIRAGRGHAFTNRGPLLALVQTLRDQG